MAKREPDGWSEWSHHILAEIERLDQEHREMEERERERDRKLERLIGKCTVLAIIAGAAVAVLMDILFTR